STEVTKSVAATGVTRMAAINAAAQNRITRIIKKIPLHSSELLILLSMDRHLLSIDKCMATVYLMQLHDFFATAASAGGPRCARRQGFLIGRPKRDACFQCLVVLATNERRQHGLIAAGRDAEKIDDRYSVLERLAKASVIGRL